MNRDRTVFTTDGADAERQKAEITCIENGLRLENDDQVYNQYGLAVAQYLGSDGVNLRFKNLRPESDWGQMRILKGDLR